MFNVKVDNLNIQFTFKHLTDLNIEFEGKPIQAVTSCTLKINGVPYGGIAMCSALDTFNKEKGRKLALARAIAEARETLELSYSVRQAIWDRYHTRWIENHRWCGYYDGPHFVFDYTDRATVTGTLDPPYQPRSGSDSLENMA